MKKLWILAVFLFFSRLASATEPVVFPDPEQFPLPEGYKTTVQFWMRVYGEWSDNQMVIHDAENMDIIFDVVNLPGDNPLLYSARKAVVLDRVEAIRAILNDLDQDPNSRTRSDDHEKIYQLYKNISDPYKFRNAASNVRVQQGIKDRFEQGLTQMTLYISQIKRIFREQGMPEELAYLPLVESSFNNQSLSKTMAAGIWQFMPGTARLYMKVNRDVDERLDPYTATRAAALYLKKSYQMLGTWPLAITSYNHGQQGMSKAVQIVGTTDFMDIYDRYDGKYFGFASRNFYGEFLAACKVMKDTDKYFGSIAYASPQLHDSIRLSSPLYISGILNHSDLTREELRTANPALQSSVIFSKRAIPAGYELRFPQGKIKDLDVFIAKVRGSEPPPVQMASSSVSTKVKTSTSKGGRSGGSSKGGKAYVVRRGDTLSSISRKFSTSVQTIRQINDLPHDKIYPGQKLLIGSR
jgi:peptidoglycan lytic transglycosylase D